MFSVQTGHSSLPPFGTWDSLLLHLKFPSWRMFYLSGLLCTSGWGPSSLEVQGSSAVPTPYFSKNLKISHFMITVPRMDSVITGKLAYPGSSKGLTWVIYGLAWLQKACKMLITCKKVVQYTVEHKRLSSICTKTHNEGLTEYSLKEVSWAHSTIDCFEKTN